MFSGIIQEVGKVVNIEKYDGGALLSIECLNIKSDVKPGDSISVNGVCLTVIKNTTNSFCLDLVRETLDKSNLGDLSKGDSVNLERALKANGRFGGHIIQGHVETLGVILDKRQQDDNVVLSVGLNPEWMRYCIPKGSIALDGISLTISKIEANIVDVSLIPYTLQNTTLGMKSKSDTLNIETDIIGKYVNNLLSFDEDDSEIDLGIIRAIRHLQYGES